MEITGKKGWIELERALENGGYKEQEKKLDRARKYAEMLTRRRNWAGLTSRSLPEELGRIMAESAAVAVEINGEPGRILDIGAGGGLLGVILAIILEEWEVTLVESSSRKAAFLAEVAGACGLDNVCVLNKRAESMVGEGEYDFCVSRAAGRVGEIAPLALGLLRTGGSYIALKPSDIGKELENAGPAIAAAGGRLKEVVSDVEGVRSELTEGVSIVVIEKL